MFSAAVSVFIVVSPHTPDATSSTTQNDVVAVSSTQFHNSNPNHSFPIPQLPLKTLILMASEKLGMVPTHQIHNGLNPHPQLVFPEAFACAPPPPHRRPAVTGDPGPKAATREFTACFLDHRGYYHPQPHQQPPPPPLSQPPQFRHQWSANSRSPGGDATDDDDAEDENDNDDDDDDDDEEEEEEVENNMQNIVTVAKTCGNNQKDKYSADSNSHKMKHISALGDLTLKMEALFICLLFLLLIMELHLFSVAF